MKARWAQWGFSWWSFFEHTSGDLIGAGCIQVLPDGFKFFSFLQKLVRLSKKMFNVFGWFHWFRYLNG